MNIPSKPRKQRQCSILESFKRKTIDDSSTAQAFKKRNDSEESTRECNSDSVRKPCSTTSSSLYKQTVEPSTNDKKRTQLKLSFNGKISTKGALKQSSMPVSLGVARDELCRWSPGGCQLPPLRSSAGHTVLIKTSVKAGVVPLPHPESLYDKWDSNHVKMPCSAKNICSVPGRTESRELRQRWGLIETALQSTMQSPLDLKDKILAYNDRYKQVWNFQALCAFLLDVLEQDEMAVFFADVLPRIVHLALQLPHICTKPIPLLKRGRPHSMTMSQEQAACLLANAFLCTFPGRNTQQKYSHLPDINFNNLFRGCGSGISPSRAGKLRCLIHYFRRVTSDMPSGVLTFTRCVLTSAPSWYRDETSLSRLHVSSSGTIEDDGAGMLQVDFANKLVGGGVLGFGCVQEEIRFVICPELLISRLFTEALNSNECLRITGCERFSDYTGYGDTFRWTRNHQDTTPRDSWQRRCTEVVAIDALQLQSYQEQFNDDLVCRELNKAFCGFQEDPLSPSSTLPAVATGNWGCGAFGGDPQLKALLQMMAAAAAGRDVCYFTFGDESLARDVHAVHRLLTTRANSIAAVWALIQDYHNHLEETTSIYEFIHRHFSSENNPQQHQSKSDSAVETEQNQNV